LTGNTGNWFGWIAAMAIVLSIGAGLMLIGGPGEARAEKNDRAKMKALKSTAAAIACYAKNIGDLPESFEPILQAVENSTSGIHDSKKCRRVNWETDPISGDEFEYRRKSKNSFELCAVFERADDPNSSADSSFSTNNDVLIGIRKTRTEAGRQCYIGESWN